jgi:AcrR family transcriptional regulator
MTSPATERAPTKRSMVAQNTKSRMIRAAIAVFSEHGYEKATTRELAERAGVSEGLIYRHFGGKRELLFASLEAERDESPANFDPLTDAATLEQHLESILKNRMNRMMQHRDFMRVCMSLAAIDSELGHLMVTIEEQTVANLIRHLETLRDKGLINPTADLNAAASGMNMLVFGMAFNWQVIFGRSRAHSERYAVALASILTTGLAAN